VSALLAPVSQRLRLYQFTTDFNVGGTEGQMVTFLKGLNRERFDVHMGCLRRTGTLLGEVQALQIPITQYRVRSFYRPDTTAEQLRCARELWRLRVQIFHSYNFYGNLFAIPAARLARVPLVVAGVRNTGANLSPLQQRAQVLVCRMAHRVLVNAQAVRRWLVELGVPAGRITVIPNGIDVARFAGPRDPRVRSELGVPAAAPLIVMLSRLVRQKGIDDLLEAAAQVVAEIPAARFLIVGQSLVAVSGDVMVDQAYLYELRAHVERLGLEEHVTFTGLRRDVPAILAEAAVSVLPSLSEGLSNTLLESMAAGVPVVATRVGGSAEAVVDGETGFLVPARDPRALAGAILALLHDPARARTFGEAGRRRARQRFSLEQMIHETELLYEDLLRSRQASGVFGRRLDRRLAK
jgi:glycosyltransferase involved in cell wall biosynthesis